MYYKYPRTPHLPFSGSVTNDDRVLPNTENFKNMNVVVTEKMDGENTTIYRDYYHARSIDSRHRDYHSYLLGTILPKVQYAIPEGYRVCGEYLYAKHSIQYNHLRDYFYVFSVWDDNNYCLDWDYVEEFCRYLGLFTVPILYKGLYDEGIIREIAKLKVDSGREGIVVRNYNSFHYNEFDKNIAKYVRPNHVQTDEHWSHGKIEINHLHKGVMYDRGKLVYY